jgi:hypothetical protein
VDLPTKESAADEVPKRTMGHQQQRSTILRGKISPKIRGFNVSPELGIFPIWVQFCEGPKMANN